MKTLSLKHCLILVVLLAVCGVAAQGQRRRRGAVSPAAPQAKLTRMIILQYNSNSDSFSDASDDPGAGLFNDLDTSLLVKVEVTGKAGEFSERTVQITARQGRKVILNQNAMVGIYNDGGKYYVTAWIYNPICENTVITATLMGQRQPSTIRKTVNAHCGE
jgi:hypothetical protein